MSSKLLNKYFPIALLLLIVASCKPLESPIKNPNTTLPLQYTASQEVVGAPKVPWRSYFTDPNLIALIDSALARNQELNITMQEIEMVRNEIEAKKGEYLPFVSAKAGIGPDRAGKYTWDGLSEEQLKEDPEKAPKYIGDFGVSAVFSWEIDVWKKLHHAKDATVARYLATVEGKNFMITNIIAEIANSYYELLALDNQISIIRQNIEIQENALHIAKQQKEASRATQLAVNRFEAQLLHTQNLQYDILQQIVETENRINFLTGSTPKPISRNAATFNLALFDTTSQGIPSQLLENRPDIRQAEQQLAAAKLDVQAAKANFLPNIRLSSELGLQAFNPTVWFRPSSILYNIFGDLMAPIMNKRAIKAAFMNAQSQQMQAVTHYERTILNAYIEVVNQLSAVNNYSKSLDIKSKEVDILIQSVSIADNLFKSARADYIEVLLTQREVLESKMELIEIKKKRLSAEVNLYKALGGGWN